MQKPQTKFSLGFLLFLYFKISFKIHFFNLHKSKMKIKLFIASSILIGIIVYKVIKDFKPKPEPSLTEEELKEQLRKIHDRELQMMNINF
jgi:hypothetical protein